MTNVTDTMFDIPCLTCGYINAVAEKPGKPYRVPANYVPKYLQRSRQLNKNRKKKK